MGVVIITGMHRSGTSLVASFLHYCGLHIGETLIGSKTGNVKGHYENKLFVDFHKKVIKNSKQNYFIPKKINLSKEDISEAKEIIQSNSQFKIWGWKDPRTVFFLKFWNNQLTDKIKFIFIYRRPEQVIDSLIRRNTDLILKLNPLLTAKAWLIYNREILAFCKTQNIDFSIYNLDDVIHHPTLLIEDINRSLDEQLQIKNIDDLFDTTLLKNTATSTVSRIVFKFYQKQLNSVFADLENMKVSPV